MKWKWRYFMLKNQTIWLFRRTLGLKQKHQTVKLLEITCSTSLFYGCLLTCKNQHHSIIQSWHIADSILETTSGMTTCAWPQPYEQNDSNKCIYVYLFTCRKPTSAHYWDIPDSLFLITLGISGTLTEPHQTPRFKEYCIEIGMGFFTPRRGFCRKLEFENY